MEWVVALYDYAGRTEEELSFQQGDCILVTKHMDAEWSCGRLNGREGLFPRNYAESTTGVMSLTFELKSFVLKRPCFYTVRFLVEKIRCEKMDKDLAFYVMLLCSMTQ